MKIYQVKKRIQTFMGVLALCFLSTAVWAQDGGADVNVKITKESSTTWYTQPWVWVVGGAVFLLLLVALLRGGGNKD